MDSEPLNVIDRGKFNELVYTSWSDAVEELEKRTANTALEAYTEKVLVHGVPSAMENKKSMVLFRHVATPNYEVSRFLIAADTLNHLQPLILEYTQDKFNNRNEWKFSLAKLRFHKGHSKNGEALFEYKNIIDINDSNNKPIADIKTLSNKPLVDFHHNLFEAAFPQFKNSAFDLSGWLHKYGSTAKEYYKPFLTLFLKHGILFENFLIDGEGKEIAFVTEIILPALEEIQRESGYRPLIVALEPTDKEDDAFWLSHPISRKEHVHNLLNS